MQMTLTVVGRETILSPTKVKLTFTDPVAIATDQDPKIETIVP
jgi:hypothetical protein